MGAFESLMSVADQLQEWVIHAAPATDPDRDQMRAVLAQRWALEQKLNELFAYRLKLTVAAVPIETAQLQRLSQTMLGTEKKIEMASQVVTIAGTALALAGKLLTFALG